MFGSLCVELWKCCSIYIFYTPLSHHSKHAIVLSLDG